MPDGPCVFMLAPCCSCGRVFACNPYLVPSVPREFTRSGEKEPLCEPCVRAANPERIKRGLDPITIIPGAYEPQNLEPEGDPS